MTDIFQMISSTKSGSGLYAKDPFLKHIRALQDRYAGTGSRSINSEVSSDWIRDLDSLLWFHSIPGCGKTALCSTAIEKVLVHHNTAVGGVMAVGYFSSEFNEQEKQRCNTKLRSVIAQSSLQGRQARQAPGHTVFRLSQLWVANIIAHAIEHPRR